MKAKPFAIHTNVFNRNVISWKRPVGYMSGVFVLLSSRILLLVQLIESVFQALVSSTMFILLSHLKQLHFFSRRARVSLMVVVKLIESKEDRKESMTKMF